MRNEQTDGILRQIKTRFKNENDVFGGVLKEQFTYGFVNSHIEIWYLISSTQDQAGNFYSSSPYPLSFLL